MSDPARISDMLGLHSEAHESESIWPLNFVLLVLGGAILGVAFVFLDVADPRLLYNPWTYAIATPVALMGLSAILSSVVSRVVEKSMQLAFLLSVLIHLVLLVCAFNAVIFSRMWPNVLDSLDQQREQLKREVLQAKQYHRVAVSTQSGRRPDYLKPAQTEHQPTEIEPLAAPMLALARSDRANLVSPSPRIELSHSPSLLERDRTITSLPSSSEAAAALSRSDIAAPRAAAARPRAEYLPLDTSEPAPMTPSPSALARKADARSSDLSQTPSLPLEPPRASAPSSERNSAPRSSKVAERLQAPSALDRQSMADLRPNARAPRDINTPDTNLQSAASGEMSAAGLADGQRRNLNSPRGPTSLSPPSAAPSMAPRINPLANSQPPRASSALTPTPATSDTALAMPRNMAGGSLGSAAPSSMPVRGIDDLGTAQPDTSAQARIDSTVNSVRRSTTRSTLSHLPTLGSLGANSWNGTPSLSGGTAGLSPSQLARSSDQGSASSQDVADLAGARRDLERSTLSRSGQPSPSAVRGIDELLSEELLSGPTETSNVLDFSGENPAALSAAGAAVGRTKSDSTALPANLGSRALAPDFLSANSSLQSSTATARAERARMAESNLPESASASDALATAELPRNDDFSSSAPGLVRIGVPDLDSAINSSSTPSVTTQAIEGAALARRSATDSPRSSTQGLAANLLAIEAPLGPGGIASSPGLAGAILNRRDAALDNWTPPQLEAQPLARQDVGGPLAAGQQVALPKPAFQQRIDRLKDRQPQDESSLEPQTELAIERGLEFLAKRQRPDGSWRLQDFDTAVLIRSDTAATALCLLAFQGAGYTHNQFKYANTVDQALQFLVAHQSVSGDLYIPQDPASDQNAWLYSHAIAALAICEAVGMTQDNKLRPAAQKAIDFMVASQDPQRGGWRYRPGVGADTSVTGWFMMAFKSGQLAGLNVPPDTMQAIEKFVGASQVPEGESHLYRYNPFAADTPQQRHGLQPTSVMTSVGLLMRLYFGWKRDRAEMLAGADYLLEHLPEHGSETASRRDTYYWYYATQVMFHMRGQHWQQWHDRLYPLLINSQTVDGELAGSWDPNYPTPDLWARYGGRLYVTTLNLLSLEVSYRHLPLYEATSQ